MRGVATRKALSIRVRAVLRYRVAMFGLRRSGRRDVS